MIQEVVINIVTIGLIFFGVGVTLSPVEQSEPTDLPSTQEPPTVTDIDFYIQTNSVVVRWNIPPHINGNVIRYEVNYQFISWVRDCKEKPKTKVSGNMYLKPSTPTANVTGLSPAAKYEISVAAVTRLTKRGPWTTKYVTTHAAVPDGHPRNLTSTYINSSQIYLSWKPPNCSQTYGRINYYRVRVYKVFNDKKPVHICDKKVSEAEAKIINLEPATNYKIYVVAANRIGESQFHASIVLKTKEITNDEIKLKVEYIIAVAVAVLVMILLVIIIFFRIRRSRRINHFESFAMRSLFTEDEVPVESGTNSNNRWSMESGNSSSRVSVRKLESYFNNMLQSGRLQGEYFSLKKGKQFPCLIAVAPGNMRKNRYRNVLAYDHTRVAIQKWPDSYSEYINANYIDGYKTLRKYIATQGPLDITVNDFWKMIWQENVQKIVIATKLTEARKAMCEKYWPDTTEKYGCVTVTIKGTQEFTDYIIRSFSVSKGNATRELKQFHYSAWPTRGVPTYTSSVIRFLKQVRSYQHDGRNPIVVQCSGGTGRTGTLILVDIMLDMAEKEQHVDILQCFTNMRNQRINVIDTVDQYIFAYQVLIDALCKEDTSIPCKEFHEYYKKLRLLDPSKRMTRLEIQFQKLKKLNPSARSVALSRTFDIFRRQTWIDWKNRTFSELSVDCRSSIRAAVYVDGYRQKNTFVVTNLPEPHTTCDFWRMIYQTSSKTIVLLHSLESEESICYQYWSERKTEQYGEYIVTHVESEKLSSGIKVRTFNIIKQQWNNTKEVRTVKQFHVDCWVPNQVLPPNSSIILDLVDKVEKWQQEIGSHVVTVQCFNGACASGVYCAAVYILDKIKAEQEIDVFEAVRTITTHKPYFVESLAQYAFLYDLAKKYLEQFSTYANFQ